VTANTNPLDGLFPSTPAPIMATHKTSELFAGLNTGGAPTDPFGSLIGSSGGTASSSVGAARGAAAISAKMNARLQGLRRSHMTDQPIANNSALSITHFKAYAPDRTIVALFISNLSSQTIANITVTVDLPPGMMLVFEGDPVPTVRHNSLLLNSLSAGVTTTQLVYTWCRDASVSTRLLAAQNAPAACSLSVQCTYGDAHDSSNVLRGAVQLDFADLIRPSTMDTPRFGALWKVMTHERKFALSRSKSSAPVEFMGLLRDNLSFWPVQTIRDENIMAARLISPATLDSTIVLVHGKQKAGSALDVMVRSTVPDLTAVTQTHVQRLLDASN